MARLERWAWSTLARLGPLGPAARAAARIGLEPVAGSPVHRARWIGRVGSRTVALMASRDGAPRAGLRLDLSAGEAPGPRALITRLAGGDLTRSGDRTLLAALGSEVARELRPGEGVGASPQLATFTSERRDAPERIEGWLNRLGWLLDEARADLPRRLLERALRDPSPTAREAATEALLVDHPLSAEATRIRAGLVRTDRWALRLGAAAAAGGDRARASWLGIAVDAEAPEETRSRALDHLLAEGPPSRVEAGFRLAIDRLARTGPLELRRRATALAGRVGPIMTPTLDAVYAEGAVDLALTAVAAASGLGEAAEPLLLGWLERGPRPGLPRPDRVRLERAILGALGERGGARSLPALLARCEGAGWFAPTAETALTAAARVRARLPRSPRGALALSDGAGAVSDC